MRQTAGSQLVWTHQDILTHVAFNAKALSHLFTLECHREPFHVHAAGAGEHAAMLVEGLDLGGVGVWVEVETLGGTAIEEARAAPRCTLEGCQFRLGEDGGMFGGSGGRTQVPQSPPQTLLQRPFCHLPAMVDADTICVATIGAGVFGADTTGADTTGAGLVGEDTTGAEGFGADMIGRSDGSVCMV